ncbi:MAG: T9SS type A sorting domain-containing protein [Ignavibacteria bacterium]|nr:T9SS type A sorting domain-containing protein [Ignavibacteria bacterium]
MKKLLTFFLIVMFSPCVFAQIPSTTIYNPPLPFTQNFSDWGTDLVVSPNEPLGRPSGVYRASNSTIYVAVPDTTILPNACIVVLMSSNNGANWSIGANVSTSSVISKTKMVAKGDSLYCVFLYGTSVYCWNVITNNFNAFTNYTSIRDFDVTISSTASLYLIVDILTNNDVRVFGSINGGQTWPNAVYLTATGVFPRIYMSGSGDTSLINYYGVSITADTISSAIRSVRYRESAPGTLAIVGSFSTPVAAGTPKDQMMAVRNFDKAWLFYTTGTTGNIDLNCMVSSDGGTSFGTAFTIGSLPSRDEYWFDAKCYNPGVDLIYYSDSIQTGAPTAQSDKMFNCFATAVAPSTFSTPVSFSQKPPSWSARGYIPTLIEYYNTGNDAGAIWVGVDGANRRLYFDRYSAVTRISNNESLVPDKYYLGQNYPNPFNPETKIDFTIPKNGFVSIKIFDITGKEITTLVSTSMNKGSYTVNYNASQLSSGVYFYKLSAGSDFSESRKMILIK